MARKTEEEICHHIQNVCYCVEKKSLHQKHVAPLSTITTTRSLEIIGIDFLHLDTCNGGYEYLLVVTDHFTKHAQAYSASNKSAKTAADMIYMIFSFVLECLKRSYLTKGENFKITCSNTYHFIKYHINKFTHANDCTSHSTSGYSLYHLLFGQKPKLPIDIIPGNHNNTKHKNNRQTVYNQISGGNKAYELAVQRSINRKMKDKGSRDRRAGPLYPGDTKFI